MQTEQELWDRFVKVEREISKLKHIVHSGSIEFQNLDSISMGLWLKKGQQLCSDLASTITSAYSYLEITNNAKDI